MRVYLASRYSRRQEMNIYADQLREYGYIIDVRWLVDNHQAPDDTLEINETVDTSNNIAAVFAQDDVEDLMASDIVISFSEEPRSTHSRGGRHVEFGMALALNKQIIVVGPRENIFHTLPGIKHYETWDEALNSLK